jgi:hypothetical protein
MVPRAEDATLPEPTPNPYLTPALDDYDTALNGHCSSNKLKLRRVPMDRR